MKRKLLLFFALLIAVGMKAAEDLQPTNVTPEIGATYLISENDGSIVFTFDRQLKIDKAYIIPANGNPIEIDDIVDMYTNAYYYYCKIGSQMKVLIKNGTITAGGTFQIKLQGIKDAEDASISYNDVTATFVAGNLPAELVSIKPQDGETINSYYAVGGTDGLITFTFTDPVVCESAKVSYGNVEDGTFGSIDLQTPVASGSVLTADIQGIKLSPADINKQTSITLQISRVKTTDGVLLEGNIPGSPGTYAVNYNIKSSSVEVSYRFTPDKGSNIDNVEQLKCYFSYPITFDGVKLSYTLGGGETNIVIPKEQITIENDPNDDEGAFFAYIPIKDLSFDAGNVDVEFVGGMDLNGNAVEVKGTFLSAGKHADVTTCLSVTPTPGSKLVPRPEAFVFTFSDLVTMDNMLSVLVIGGDEMPLRDASVDKNVLTVRYNNTMYGDLTFKLRLTNTAGNPITYGDTKDYVTVSYSAPSDIFTCSIIDPAVGKVESLKTFTLTFNGIDDFDQVGGFDDKKEIILKDESGSTVADGTIDFSDNWDNMLDAIITLNKEITETGIYTLVVPEKTVYNSLYDGNMDDFGVSAGAIYNPELTFTYTIGDVTPTTCTNVDPAPAQNMDAIPTQFAFTFSRNVTLSSARMTSDENPRGGVDISEYVAVADNVLTITLPEGMTDSYTFVNFMLQVTDITGAYVTYGDVDDYVVAGYTKKVEANTFVCSFITPEEGGVASLKEFILTFVGVDEFDMVGGFDTTKEIVLKDEVGAIVTTGTIDFSDFDHPMDAIISLEKEVAENGTYTLTIPEGTVYNGLYDDMAEDFGVSFGAIYNPELTYTYIILAHGIDSVMAGELSGIVEVYSLQGVLLRKADASEALKGLTPGIYIVNGKKIAVK